MEACAKSLYKAGKIEQADALYARLREMRKKEWRFLWTHSRQKLHDARVTMHAVIAAIVECSVLVFRLP